MILPRVGWWLGPAVGLVVGLVVAATEMLLVLSQHRAGTAMTISSPPSLPSGPAPSSDALTPDTAPQGLSARRRWTRSTWSSTCSPPSAGTTPVRATAMAVREYGTVVLMVASACSATPTSPAVSVDHAQQHHRPRPADVPPDAGARLVRLVRSGDAQ
ncbi:hypothetical protein [Streptomyces sp. ISL-98]|uniref:hypothetical protein n=1 Tax=Streptomyces sp. ISL-98 TaxID=2819192 RepID=UPI0027E46D11|nr:hypothetical protein [Streptomyces sp. ISL-98]